MEHHVLPLQGPAPGCDEQEAWGSHKGKSLVGHERSQKTEEEYYDPNHQKRSSREGPHPLELVASSPKKPQRPLWRKRWNAWNRVRVKLLLPVSGDSEVLVRLSLPLPSVGWTSKMMLAEIPPCQVVTCPLIWRTCGGVPARKALIGTATSTLGPRARKPALARLLMRSMRSTMSGIFLSKLWGKVGQAGWSIFFLWSPELAREAVSCHLTLNLLCQELQDAWSSLHCRHYLLPTVAAFGRFCHPGRTATV